MAKNNQTERIDSRFVIGFLLIIFLVLMNSFVKEIPALIIVIPSLIMGVDITDIIKAIRKK